MENSTWLLVTAYSFWGAAIGIVAFFLSVPLVPWVLKRLTPTIDEDKEILKGNTAVATYFGILVGATILGLALIIAAAVFAGVS